MTEENVTPSDTTLPEAAKTTSKKISLIWVVPVVALLIGLGLVYTALTEKGPDVTIVFSSAEGLEAGKTKVKYKDVTIGKVTAVDLTEDFTHVRATVSLVKEAEEFLSENSRFWIVRPRLHGSIISGMDTLLSGSYVAIDPGEKGEPKTDYKGLDAPPIITGSTPGKLFTLMAKNLGSLDYGSPVYYRDISVGKVVGYGLKEGGKGVDIQIFVDAPYDEYVTPSSRFWVTSGVDLEMDAEGVRFNTESLMSMLAGGIAFATPEHAGTVSGAGAAEVYQLFETQKVAMSKEFRESEFFVLKFQQSVRGLSVGAPVEFKGFPIGQVADIGIEFNWKNKEVLVPVTIKVEGERLAGIASSYNEPKAKDMLTVLVEQGMRGQVRTSNLLTGKLYVALDFFSDAEPADVLVAENGIKQIPTIPTPIEELTTNLSALLKKLQKLPVEDIGKSTLAAINSIKATGDKFERIAGSEDLKIALKETRTAMENANALVAKDSATVVELQRALRDLGDAAKSIRSLADQLERNPESLLRGKRRE